MNNQANTIINLGDIPLVNNLKDSCQQAIDASRYALRMVEDKDMVFRLDLEIDPSLMFTDYLYRSSVNEPYKVHCRNMVEDMQKFVDLSTIENPTIIDVGGNDGTLLKEFRNKLPKFARFINVDPSQSFVQDNLDCGIEYSQMFWADYQSKERASVIVSTNVFQHNADVHGFLRSIQENLNGVWILEFPYFLRTAQTGQFDQIYHEHYYYWMITPLAKLFAQYGLSIISMSEHAIHGGTMRIISTNRGTGHCEAVQKYIDEESLFDFKDWGMRVHSKIKGDEEIIRDLLKIGKVACFGAGAKSCVYLNCIDQDLVKDIEYVVDDTLVKQGKFMPGTSLCVVDRNRLYEDQPDYLIILIHNFKDHIITSLRPHYKGKIIVMVPTVEKYN